jgi:hypothetical protein
VINIDIKLGLILQEPIDFQGVKIYQPTLYEIFQCGVNIYNSLLLPYSLTWDMIGISEEKIEGLKFFDIVIKDKTLRELFVQSLMVFCHTDKIDINNDSIKIESGLINRDNFDEFGDIILQINAREKQKIEKLPENPKQREIELKLRALRAKVKPKNEFQLYDIINNVRYGGKYYIPMSEIQEMTLWSLYNAFNSKVGLSNYDATFSIALVAGDKNKTLEDNHWTKLLKIDK